MLLTENKNYYPTPNTLIEKMISGIKWKEIKTVLEPSAGSGNIVDEIMPYANANHWSNPKPTFSVDCIEIDEQLQATLKVKGYRLVYNNFLTFNTCKKYDLIIMNPPFDNGAKHLLKALEMQSNGGCVVCLLNAETIKNAYSNERKALKDKLSELNASIEYIENAFMTAERQTAVEVALVKVIIDSKEEIIDKDIFDKFKPNKKAITASEPITDQENMLTCFSAENSFIELAVEQYETETKMGIELIQVYKKMKPYLLKTITKDKKNTFSNYEYSLFLVLGNNEDNARYNSKTIDENDFIKIMRLKYWNALFQNPKFTGKLTQNLKEELDKKVEQYADYDFNVFNIYELAEEMQLKTTKGIEDTIITLFNELTYKYAYATNKEFETKNIHYFNGWVTNKCWFINKKVIIPYLNSGWEGQRKLSDIHKALSYLDYNNDNTDANIEQMIVDYKKAKGIWHSDYIEEIPLPYFTIRFYKKGTAHITFTNQEILDKFNLFCCKNKNMLPPHFGKKKYEDMTNTEQQVATEFMGSKENYNKVYNNQDKYLLDFSTAKYLLLN